MTPSVEPSRSAPIRSKAILAGLLFSLALIFLLAFGESRFKGFRLQLQMDSLGPAKALIVRFFDLFYGPIKYSIYGQIVGLFLSLAAVLITFQIAQRLYSGFGWGRKHAERLAVAGTLVWVLVAFNWISQMPIAFIGALVLLILIGYNRSTLWWPVLVDPENGSSRSVLLAYLSLLVMNGFFWWPGYQLFCSLGVVGIAVGDNTAALYGRWKGKHRLRFNKAGRTLEGTAAMFGASFAANILIATLMIHIPGMQEELYRFLIILLATTLSTAAETFSPPGWDNFLIGPVTAFPIYFYIH